MASHSQRRPSSYQPVRVLTNAYSIERLPSHRYTQYTKFEPNFKGKAIAKKQQYIHHLEHVVCPDVFTRRFLYDGSKIGYAHPDVAQRLGPNKTFFVALRSNTQFDPSAWKSEGKTSCIKITFSATSGVEILPTHAAAIRGPDRELHTNLLQLLVRQGSNNIHPNNGKAYFPPFSRGEDLKILPNGIEIRRGIFHSVRPTMEKMIVTIDTVASLFFPHGSLLEAVSLFLRESDWRSFREDSRDPNIRSKFHKMLKYFKGLKIRVTHPRKSSTSIKCIMGFVSDGGGFKFDFEGKMITVAQHYRTAHNVTLSHPFAPGVILRKEPHMVVVPMELCELVPNQMFKKKVPDDMAGDMVKFAAVNPSDRFQKIKLAANNYHRFQPMVESGMVISRDPLTVEGKLLNPPMIKYDCRTQEPKNGGWNVLNQKLLKPMPMRLWAILNCEPTRISSQQAWGIAKTLADCCKALGMRIDKPPIVVKDYSGGSLSSVLDSVMQESSQILQRHGIDLRKTFKEFMLIVLLPSEAAHLRTEVKYWGDAVNGVKTQCLRFGKTMNNQYCNNVALKINARLGGTNSFIQTPNQGSSLERLCGSSRTMIVGADIGHPGAGIRNKPSVSGLVFSISQFATEYAAITRIQPPRVEAIVDLEEMFRYAMDKFRKSANGLPHNIIFFRDGVSEGEFATITNTEIKVLQEVIDAFHNEISPEKPKPKLTFVAVGKRHHTLLFPPHGSNLADRKGNCHPGVAVDSGITQPFLPNFYLQSHAAIQGTSRSSHYIVLRDEVFAEYRESAILQLEELAYGLCHIYAKATRSVSIPAPVYYADLVCRRGMFHIDPRNQNVSFDDTTSIHTSGTEPPFDLEPWKNAFKPLHGALEPAMYFL